MTGAIRITLSVVVLTAILAAFGLARPGWVRSLGVQWKKAPRLGQIAPPSEKSQIAKRRIEARMRVIHRLGQSEMTLFEAAAWFRYLNETPADYVQESWKVLPGRSDNEKLCRQVLAWARNHLQDVMPPSQAEITLCSLEHELAAHIARHGKVILPSE